MIGYLRFEIARMVRNRRYLFFTIGMPALFYLVFSQTGSNADAKIDGTTWGTYFMVSMAAFGALTAGFNAGGPRLAGERVSGWVRQLRITPLPGWAYVAVKVLTGVLMALPAIVVISAIAALDNHVSLAPTTWLQTVLALWAASIPFAALGVMFGFLINSETANPIMGIAMFLLAFFGGMFTPVQALPPHHGDDREVPADVLRRIDRLGARRRAGSGDGPRRRPGRLHRTVLAGSPLAVSSGSDQGDLSEDRR